jgi:hypothetical protein
MIAAAIVQCEMKDSGGGMHMGIMPRFGFVERLVACIHFPVHENELVVHLSVLKPNTGSDKCSAKSFHFSPIRLASNFLPDS